MYCAFFIFYFFCLGKKKERKKSVRGPRLIAQVERVEKRHSEDEALTGASWGRILALREIWWCRDDIFRAAVRVIDEYQMLFITPWE